MTTSDEIDRLEEKLRAELNRLDAEATQYRHGIRGDIQKILVELAEKNGRSVADTWIIRALIALASIETTFLATNLHKLL